MTIVNWSQYPEPWNRIGPAFAAEAQKIAKAPMIGGNAHHPAPIVCELRNQMAKLGMTRRYLAKALGYELRTINNWFDGVRHPSSAATDVIKTFLTKIRRNGL